jgi:hypothetical protein
VVRFATNWFKTSRLSKIYDDFSPLTKKRKTLHINRFHCVTPPFPMFLCLSASATASHARPPMCRAFLPPLLTSRSPTAVPSSGHRCVRPACLSSRCVLPAAAACSPAGPRPHSKLPLIVATCSNHEPSHPDRGERTATARSGDRHRKSWAKHQRSHGKLLCRRWICCRKPQIGRRSVSMDLAQRYFVLMVGCYHVMFDLADQNVGCIIEKCCIPMHVPFFKMLHKQRKMIHLRIFYTAGKKSTSLFVNK